MKLLSDKENCRGSLAKRERIHPHKNSTLDRRMSDQDPPIGDIRMIVGETATAGSSKKARKTYLRMVQKVQLTGTVPKIAGREGLIIRFSEEDARHLRHPHDDALIVSMRVGDYNMHRVLVDNGSSADILYYPVFQQMRIDKEQLMPMNAPLVGF